MERLIMVINVCPLWKYVTEAVYFSYFGAILVQFVALGHMRHLSVTELAKTVMGVMSALGFIPVLLYIADSPQQLKY